MLPVLRIVLIISCLAGITFGHPIDNSAGWMHSKSEIWAWLNPLSWMGYYKNETAPMTIVNSTTKSHKVTPISETDWKGRLTITCDEEHCKILHCHSGQCVKNDCYLPLEKTSPECLNYGFVVKTAFPKVNSRIITNTSVATEAEICGDQTSQTNDSMDWIYRTYIKYPFVWLGLLSKDDDPISTVISITETDSNQFGELTILCDEETCEILLCYGEECKQSICHVKSSKTSQECLIYSFVVLSTFPEGELTTIKPVSTSSLIHTTSAVPPSESTPPPQDTLTSTPLMPTTKIIQSLFVTDSPQISKTTNIISAIYKQQPTVTVPSTSRLLVEKGTSTESSLIESPASPPTQTTITFLPSMKSQEIQRIIETLIPARESFASNKLIPVDSPHPIYELERIPTEHLIQPTTDHFTMSTERLPQLKSDRPLPTAKLI